MVREEADLNAQDFKTSLLKLKNTDAIVFSFFPPQTNIIFKQMVELDMADKKTFTTEALVPDVTEIEYTREAMNRTKTISSWLCFDDKNMKTSEFIKQYEERFDKEPSPFSAYFYDDVYVISLALKKCEEKNMIKDTECLVEEMHKIDYEGISGRIKFDGSRINKRPVCLFQFNNGEWMPYQNKKITH